MNEGGKTGTGRPETVRLTVQVGRADTLRQGVAVKMGTNTQGLEILSNMEFGDHSLSGMREIRLKDNAKNVRNCRFLIILDLSTAVTTGFISLFHASPSQRWRDCVRACVCVHVCTRTCTGAVFRLRFFLKQRNFTHRPVGQGSAGPRSRWRFQGAASCLFHPDNGWHPWASPALHTSLPSLPPLRVCVHCSRF